MFFALWNCLILVYFGAMQNVRKSCRPWKMLRISNEPFLSSIGVETAEIWPSKVCPAQIPVPPEGVVKTAPGTLPAGQVLVGPLFALRYTNIMRSGSAGPRWCGVCTSTSMLCAPARHGATSTMPLSPTGKSPTHLARNGQLGLGNAFSERKTHI